MSPVLLHIMQLQWSVSQEYLDVSHNELERFPPSAEQFWSGSLTRLFVNNNQLDQLDENILKLGNFWGTRIWGGVFFLSCKVDENVLK